MDLKYKRHQCLCFPSRKIKLVLVQIEVASKCSGSEFEPTCLPVIPVLVWVFCEC